MQKQKKYKAASLKRNPIVRIARSQNGAGYIKDKRTRRGGARNKQAEWLAEWEDYDA